MPRRCSSKEGPGATRFNITDIKGALVLLPKRSPALLYDRFTQHSVWIISRLADLRPTVNYAPKDRYGAFADMWLAMYNNVLPLINDADLQGYPYKVRVFDKVLWIAGEPNYNRDPCRVGLAAGAAKS